MLIYCITNIKTGKQYVGQTKNTLRDRWKAHISHAKAGRSQIICSAIQKYGVDSFQVEQIDEAQTQLDLDVKESQWIKKLNTISPNGYNIMPGNVRGIRGGDLFSKRVRDGLKHRCVTIVQLSSNGSLIRSFVGISECSRELNLNKANIHKSCKLKGMKLVDQFRFMYKSEFDELGCKIPSNINSIGRILKPVYAVDMYGNKFQFTSITEAASAMNKSRASIINYLRNPAQSFYGLSWFESKLAESV